MATKPKLTKRKKMRLFHRTRNNFLTGVVIVAPVMLTFYLIWWVINLVDGLFVPWVPAMYNPSTYLGVNIPGFGVVVFLVFTASVGALTKGLFGRQLLKTGENIVDRMPVIRSVYNALKQISETVLSKSNASFQKACLVEYPRTGIWAIAFVSTETGGEIAPKLGETDMLSIFLPTTPNPTSGFLLFVPRKDLVILDMSVEEAAKLVISAGLVTPPTADEIAAGEKPVNTKRK
ncbi:MAG: DUF502 domain-containing protein [Rhodobacteraceae bacterium]|nr:DUF502 domain-containing protein [Paracoccaceae bacterium]